MRLTQVRCGGAFIILLTYVFFRYREKLRTTRADLPHLAIYGVVGFLAVQALYFVAISRLHVSIALIMEFTAPIWIVIWLRYVKKKYVPPLMWISIFMAFSGLVLIAQVWRGRTLDPIGVIAALADGIVLATFFLLGEKLTAKHEVKTLMVYGFGFATLAMALILPLWSFPTEIFTQSMDLQGRFSEISLPGWVLIAWIIIMGTIIPYLLVVSGLKLLSASTSSVMGMSEPILAGVFAWIWLSEKWGAIQLLGGAIVIVGIILADKARTAAH
ncbi:MAG: EamA-like transporter family protein [Actinobacteria bacterium]|nr:EamA-like transporter family protein [Actinomycetota bacterium]